MTIQARITDDPTDVLKAVATLSEHSSDLPCGPRLLQSIGRVMGDGSYRFVVADDGHGGPPVAAGVVTFFHHPMIDNHVLAVEALWLQDDLAAQRPVWRLLSDFTRKLDFDGVCVSARSTNVGQALREFVERGELDGDPVTVGRPLLQKQNNPSPVWSAFSEEPITDRAFISLPAVLVHTRKVEVDFSGREHLESGPLYRGEGRLEFCPHWKCANLDALAAIHFSKGFYARPRALPAGSTDPFRGTIAEQLLHQGYVGQGAVSLSTSFEVAATYAIDIRGKRRGKRREEALVFAIDAGRLRRYTKIFDSAATLAAACPWIPTEAWTSLRRVVRALWTDLPAAGHFLDRCYTESLERARVGGGTLAPRPNVFAHLSPGAQAALEAGGVSREDLNCVHDVFEEFADFAEQRVGSIDELHLDDAGGYTVKTHRAGPMAYFEVFARIKNALRKELGEHANPGWDTTPFGYIAKTVRDDECFAAGSVPGEFIVEAYVVDRAGGQRRSLKPSRTGTEQMS